MNKALFFLIIIAFSATSCRFNATYRKQESDREDAEKVANALYGHIIDSSYKAADNLFHEKFFQVTPKDSLHKLYRKAKASLGIFKNNNLIEWDAQQTVGTDDKTQYVLLYKVGYSKFEATERINLIKEEGSDSIKIIGYHIDSPGFLK